MSGQQRNPLLTSSYSIKLDTKSSLLSTSTAAIGKKPKSTEEKGQVKSDRLTRQLSDKPKAISTPTIKLTGTVPKLSEKYAVSTNLNEKATTRKITEQTTAPSKSTKPLAKPVALKSTKLQTKSLLLSATKSGLLTTTKSTTPPLTSSLKSSPKLTHLSTISSIKNIGKSSTNPLRSSYSASSAVSSLRTSHLKTQPVSKTSHSLVKPGLEASTKQKHSYRQGATGRDDVDDAAAPHYDLKLETTRHDKEDEVETFLPPELDPSIHEPSLPTISVVQVSVCIGNV